MTLTPTVAQRSAPPAVLAAAAARADAVLRTILDDEQRRWAVVDPAFDDVFDALRTAVLGGGKRLRPAFCSLGHAAAGGHPDDDAADAAAAAFELLHAFALVHDDVMDDAPTRRGLPTVHVEHAARHDLAGWRGESRRFGDAVAILVGDLAHTLADRAVHDLAPEARQVWSELQVELMLGQYLDVVGTATGDVDPRRARLIARLKSGRYTVARPLRMGAAQAGADPGGAVQGTLAAYGEPLGLAFQLRDDVLGAFGDPARTGKPVGDDLREGKPTPLLAAAWERADPAQQAVLGTVGRAGLDDGGVADIQDVLVATGALDRIEAEIAAGVREAVDALEQSPVPGAVRRDLVELARYVAGRAS